MRQVDVVVTGDFAGKVQQGTRAVVDCKCFKRRVHIKDVESFIGLVEDVDLDLGLLVTTVGFSAGAKARATRGIHLRHIPRVAVLEWAQLDDWELPPDWPEEPTRYEGDFFDYAPYGPRGARITLVGEDDWEVLAAGDDVHWADEDGRRKVARSVLTHYLRREPDNDEVEGFVAEYADDWSDGQEWLLSLDAIARWEPRPSEPG